MGLALHGGHRGARVAGKMGQRWTAGSVVFREMILQWSKSSKISPSSPPSLGLMQRSCIEKKTEIPCLPPDLASPINSLLTLPIFRSWEELNHRI